MAIRGALSQWLTAMRCASPNLRNPLAPQRVTSANPHLASPPFPSCSPLPWRVLGGLLGTSLLPHGLSLAFISLCCRLGSSQIPSPFRGQEGSASSQNHKDSTSGLTSRPSRAPSASTLCPTTKAEVSCSLFRGWPDLYYYSESLLTFPAALNPAGEETNFRLFFQKW